MLWKNLRLVYIATRLRFILGFIEYPTNRTNYKVYQAVITVNNTSYQLSYDLHGKYYRFT